MLVEFDGSSWKGGTLQNTLGKRVCVINASPRSTNCCLARLPSDARPTPPSARTSAGERGGMMRRTPSARVMCPPSEPLSTPPVYLCWWVAAAEHTQPCPQLHQGERVGAAPAVYLRR
ncbi:hypothetical protein FKM82_010776 [Ascaphus truei]